MESLAGVSGFCGVGVCICMAVLMCEGREGRCVVSHCIGWAGSGEEFTLGGLHEAL